MQMSFWGMCPYFNRVRSLGSCHMSARQNLRQLGTITPGHWYLILSWNLSGTIGVTQKTMTFETHVCLILLHTLNPQERWGTHKKRWPFRPRPFAEVIGLVCCSYDDPWPITWKTLAPLTIMFIAFNLQLVFCWWSSDKGVANNHQLLAACWLTLKMVFFHIPI